MANANRSSADMAKLAKCVRDELNEEVVTECVEEENVPRVTKTMEDCFKYALREMSERGGNFAVDFVGRRLNGDAYDRKSTKLRVTEDMCTISLYSRVIDRMIATILSDDTNSNDPEEQRVLRVLEKTFPSSICSPECIKFYYAALVESVEQNDGVVSTHPIVLHQDVPKAIRVLLIQSDWWKKMSSTKRRGLIKHLCSELSHDDIVGIYRYAHTPNHTRSGVSSVSLTLFTF